MRILASLPILAPLLGAQQFVDYPVQPFWQPLGSLAYPLLVSMADLDGDGDSDLAVVDGSSATWVRRNLGNQTWSQELVMPIPARAMAWADLDGDGDLDLLLGGLALVTGAPVPFGALRNDGAAFTWLGQVDAMPGPGAITGFAAGDADGDGDVDVVVGGQAYSGAPAGALLRLYRNDGSGHLTWDPAAMPQLQGNAFAPVLLDVDRDGDLDVLAGTESGVLLQLANAGNGAFADSSAMLPPGSAARTLAAGDLDGDGFPDLATCNGTMAVLWNSPAGALAGPQALGSGADPAVEPRLGDVDGDGLPDIVVRTEHGLLQQRNAGNRTFAPSEVLQLAARTSGLGVGDLLARGLSDAICCSLDGASFAAFGSSGGLFVDPAAVRRATIPSGIKAVADLDHDGLDDVVVTDGPYTRVLHNLGRGAFGTTAVLVILPFTPLRLRLPDLNGDGLSDAVQLSIQGLSAMLQGPPLVFAPPAQFHLIAAPVDFDVADLDGDGDADVVVASGQGLLWFANAGNGSLQSPVPVPGAPAGAVGVCALRDLDGDLDPDLLLDAPANCLSVFWNDGAGTFAAGPCLPHGGAGVRDVVVADFDGDGRPDVALAELPSGQVRWFKALAGGSFVAGPAPVMPVLSPDRLHAFDADGDGDQDLLLAGNPAVLLRNDGAGNFTADGAALPIGNLRNVAVVDVDQDADRDFMGDLPAGPAAIENRLRSAQSVQVPRVGGALRVDFHVDAGFAAPGTFVIPSGMFARAPAQQVPGVLGSLLLDGSAMAMPWVQIAFPGGDGGSVTAVPAVAALAGVDVAVQGLAFSPRWGPGFTNVVDERIMP